MKIIVERCAGLDIGNLAVGAIRTRRDGRRRRRQEVRSFGTFAEDLEALADWLSAEG